LRIQRSEGLRSRLALSIVQRDRSRDISGHRAGIVTWREGPTAAPSAS
jgi:hypothetical protein